MSISGFKISERHNTLLATIGVFPEEEKAFNLVIWLRIAAPLGLLGASLLDWLLAMVYLTFKHPWAVILAEEPQVREGRDGSR